MTQGTPSNRSRKPLVSGHFKRPTKGHCTSLRQAGESTAFPTGYGHLIGSASAAFENRQSFEQSFPPWTDRDFAENPAKSEFLTQCAWKLQKFLPDPFEKNGRGRIGV